MFISPEDAAASTVLPATQSETTFKKEHSPELVRHMLIGSLVAVEATIKDLHKLRYSEVSNWSQPIPTERPNEVMVILTKRANVS